MDKPKYKAGDEVKNRKNGQTGFLITEEANEVYVITSKYKLGKWKRSDITSTGRHDDTYAEWTKGLRRYFLLN